MKIVFMGSPSVAVPALEQLIKDKYNIAAVYTQPDRPAGRGMGLTASPIKQAALKYGLPIEQPESLKPDTVLEKLASYKPDVIAVCAYGQILTQGVLDLPPKKCINTHFSLLPRHRGAAPVMAAILEGDEFTGVSIQIVRMKLDTGPLLASTAIPVNKWDTAGTLAPKLSIIGAHILGEALGGWLRGEITPVEQDEAKATYFGQIKKEEGEIDWTKTAEEIWRRVRAFNPWPGCYTQWKGKQLKINEAEPVTAEETGNPGTVINLGNNVGVNTGKGILKLKNVQYEGKKAMSAQSFIQGQREFIGAKLLS